MRVLKNPSRRAKELGKSTLPASEKSAKVELRSCARTNPQNSLTPTLLCWLSSYAKWLGVFLLGRLGEVEAGGGGVGEAEETAWGLMRCLAPPPHLACRPPLACQIPPGQTCRAMSVLPAPSLVWRFSAAAMRNLLSVPALGPYTMVYPSVAGRFTQPHLSPERTKAAHRAGRARYTVDRSHPVMSSSVIRRPSWLLVSLTHLDWVFLRRPTSAPALGAGPVRS